MFGDFCYKGVVNLFEESHNWLLLGVLVVFGGLHIAAASKPP